MSVTNTYMGVHAKYYDSLYADKAYLEEARFVDALLSASVGLSRGKLLDVACGTGRHAREFHSLGWRVTGVDISPDLLAVAQASSPNIAFHQQDMTELEVENGESFSAITCLFDSIGYPQSNQTIAAALRGMLRHLVPEGVVAIEFLHAATLLRHGDPVRVRRCGGSDGGRLLRISESSVDARRSVMTTNYEMWESASDGAFRETSTEVHRKRFFTVEEMRALLNIAGLEAFDFLPAYHADQTITSETWRVLAMARRPR